MNCKISLAAALACSFSLIVGTASAVGIDSDRLFEQLDVDQDGLLDISEIPDQHRLLFERLVRKGDADGDGRLSATEFAGGLQPQRPEKQAVRKQGSRIPGAEALVVILSKIDANGDGVVELEEAPARFRLVTRQLLQRADGDKDGRLDRRELGRSGPRIGILAQQAAERMDLDVEAELAQLPREVRAQLEQLNANGNPGDAISDPEQAARIFERLDANSDGQIEMSELPEQLAERFAQRARNADRDGDGKVSRAEFMRLSKMMAAREKAKPDPSKTRRQVRRLLEQFDANDDGMLAREELPTRLGRRFDRIDGDESGQLEASELVRLVEFAARLDRAGANPGNGESPDKKKQKAGKRQRQERQKAKKKRERAVSSPADLKQPTAD